MRLATLSLAVCLCLVTGNAAWAQTAKEQKAYTFDMQGKPLVDVFEWLSEKTGTPFISKDMPKGTFSSSGPKGQKYTIPQIIDLINDDLLARKWLLIRSDKAFRVVPADEKVDPSWVPRIELNDLPARGNTELVSMIYPCKNLVAENIAPNIKKQMGSFGEIVILHKANQLILQDTAGNLKRIKKLLDDLDKAPALENLLAQALKNNPDLLVAEAKVREAQAELNRVRLQVTQKVAGLQREIAAGKEALKMAQDQVQRFQELIKTGALPQQALHTAESTLQKSKADLARLEAELPYLLGTATRLNINTGGYSSIIIDPFSTDAIPSDLLLISPNPYIIDIINAKPDAKTKPEEKKGDKKTKPIFYPLMTTTNNPNTFAPWVVTQDRQTLLPAATADKIRKALDTPTPANGFTYTQSHVSDLLMGLQLFLNKEKINCTIQIPKETLAKAPLFSLDLKESVPMGAVFQFVEDTYFREGNWRDWVFVVREYGIVLTENGSVPPGATRLLDLWRNRPNTATTTGTSSTTPPAILPPPVAQPKNK